VPQGVLSRTIFLGLNFHPKCKEILSEKQKTHPPIPSTQKTLAFPILILLLLAMRLTWQPQAEKRQSKHISCFLLCRIRRAKARVYFDKPITSQTVEEEDGGTIFA